MPPQVALPALQLEQRQNASSPCSPHGGIYLFPTSVFIILYKKDKTDTINNFPVYKTKNYFLFNPI
jgi:hypothetical protein